MMRSGQHDWRRQAGHDGVTPVIPGQVLSTFNQPGRDLQGATPGQGSNLVWYRASPGSLCGFRQTFQATSQARSCQIFCLPKTREVRLTQRPEWVEPWPIATRQAWLTKNNLPHMLVHYTWIGSLRETPQIDSHPSPNSSQGRVCKSGCGM